MEKHTWDIDSKSKDFTIKLTLLTKSAKAAALRSNWFQIPQLTRSSCIHDEARQMSIPFSVFAFVNCANMPRTPAFPSTSPRPSSSASVSLPNPSPLWSRPTARSYSSKSLSCAIILLSDGPIESC